MGRPVGHYVDLATRYAEDVASGKIPACRYVRLACERQLRDLERKNFPYEFDVAKAEKPCRFIEKLPHVKGEWARKTPAGDWRTIELRPWQCFGITAMFGWVARDDILDEDGDVMTTAGKRRYRHAYWETPRKNAKSTIAAGIALYLMAADGEPGADVYCTASTHKQANDAVFQTARAMVRRSKGFRRYYGAQVFKFNISIDETQSSFEPLHSRGETLDGLNVHGAVNDELHAQKRRELHDVIETACGSRSQPMLLDITTAGSDTSGICYEVRGYAVRVLERVLDDEQTFAVIYTVDEGDDWTDRRTWKKANPNWGVSVYPMAIEAHYKKAKATPSYQNTFLTKYLNVWCGAASAYFDMMAYRRCADSGLKIEQFAGEECYVGVDLSSKIDIASLAFVFSRYVEGAMHIYAFGRHFLPEKTIRDSSNAQYQGWHRQGYLLSTKGQVIDVDVIQADVEEIVEANNLQVVELDVDPMHNATQFAASMDEAGYDVIEVRPQVLTMSEPMKWLDALIRDGRFHHDGDPALAWMVSNVIAKADNKDNVYPRKERPEAKIDGVMAILTAMNRIFEGDSRYIEPTILSLSDG